MRERERERDLVVKGKFPTPYFSSQEIAAFKLNCNGMYRILACTHIEKVSKDKIKSQ